jgi:adhesin/invasin
MASNPASRSATQFGYPGCVPSISASGSLNGIVWVLDPGGVLRAYDASNLTRELYDSNRNRVRDALGATVKFSAPMIANGKVYAGTKNSPAVYGLLASPSAAVVTNAAGGQQIFAAPGSIVSIYGSGFAASSETAPGYPLPTKLGNTTVTVNNVTTPLFFASPSQINAQIPFETPLGTATVTISVNGATMGSADITIQSFAPGLFLLPQRRAAVLNQDGSVNSSGQPASAGSVIAAYLTGLGSVLNPVPTGTAAPDGTLSSTTNPVTASFGGESATVQFAGLAPGFCGLYQANIVVPEFPPGDYPLQITVGNVASNTAIVTIQ